MDLDPIFLHFLGGGGELFRRPEARDDFDEGNKGVPEHLRTILVGVEPTELYGAAGIVSERSVGCLRLQI